MHGHRLTKTKAWRQKVGNRKHGRGNISSSLVYHHAYFDISYSMIQVFCDLGGLVCFGF